MASPELRPRNSKLSKTGPILRSFCILSLAYGREEFHERALQLFERGPGQKTPDRRRWPGRVEVVQLPAVQPQNLLEDG